MFLTCVIVQASLKVKKIKMYCRGFDSGINQPRVVIVYNLVKILQCSERR